VSQLLRDDRRTGDGVSIYAKDYTIVHIEDCAAGDIGDALDCIDCRSRAGTRHNDDCPIPKAHARAFYFGAEAECNRIGFGEYKDDVANGFGFDSWASTPRNRRPAMRRYFDAGTRHEKHHR
jgi:hypothetical protein